LKLNLISSEELGIISVTDKSGSIRFPFLSSLTLTVSLPSISKDPSYTFSPNLRCGIEITVAFLSRIRF